MKISVTIAFVSDSFKSTLKGVRCYKMKKIYYGINKVKSKFNLSLIEIKFI